MQNNDLYTFLFLSVIPDVPHAPDYPEISDITTSSATVTWQPPSNDGGSEITGYVVEKKDKFGTRFTVVGETGPERTTLPVKGLQEGNEYEFRVSAVNKAGQGKPSLPSPSFVAKHPYGKIFI